MSFEVRELEEDVKVEKISNLKFKFTRIKKNVSGDRTYKPKIKFSYNAEIWLSGSLHTQPDLFQRKIDKKDVDWQGTTTFPLVLDPTPALVLDKYQQEKTVDQNSSFNQVATDFFTAKQSAGKVSSEITHRPDFSRPGKTNATIKVWDEYNDPQSFDVPFNVKENKQNLKLKPVTLYVGQKFDRDSPFENVTDKDGKKLTAKDVAYYYINGNDKDKEDTTKPGTFTVQIFIADKAETDGWAKSNIVTISVKADQTSIKAKDVTFYVGQTFNPKDAFVSATDKDGNSIPFKADMAWGEKDKPVDTTKAGKYGVFYGVYKASGQLEYTYITVTVKDRLTANPVKSSVNLARDFKNMDASSMVTDVKLGDKTISKGNYTAKLKDVIDTNTVGSRNAIVVVSAEGETVEVIVPVIVEWGNSLKINGGYYNTIMALTSHKSGLGGYAIIPARGMDQGNVIHDDIKAKYINVALIRPTGKSLEEEIPLYQITKNGSDSIKDAYKSFTRQEAKSGDIVQIEHVELNGKGKFIELSQGNSLINPTSGYLDKRAYFEIDNTGSFQPVHVNQLQVIKGVLPIYSNKNYLDQHIKEYVDLKGYSNIEVKEFSSYPITNKSGETSGEIVVEETLKSGEKVQWEYEIPFEVLEGSLDLNVPKTLTFKEFSPSKFEQIIQRKFTGDLGLTIKDSRGNEKQGGWRLTAKVQKKSTGIAPYIVFSKKGESDKSLTNAALVYSQPKQENVSGPLEVKVSTLWENDEGILLKVPPKSKLESNKTYSETINWNLVEGP
nr:bacterial Ig-like domain-containing protein [Carnobacterium maltaromaticum]